MNKRLLSLKEAAAYCGLGLNKTREWMDDISATRRIGGRVLFDVKVIDAALDLMATEAATAKEA